jgi:hypothetical protein
MIYFLSYTVMLLVGCPFALVPVPAIQCLPVPGYGDSADQTTFRDSSRLNVTPISRKIERGWFSAAAHSGAGLMLQHVLSWRKQTNES